MRLGTYLAFLFSVVALFAFFGLLGGFILRWAAKRTRNPVRTSAFFVMGLVGVWAFLSYVLYQQTLPGTAWLLLLVCATAALRSKPLA